MKKKSLELRRAEIVSKEADANREKILYNKYKDDIQYIVDSIEDAINDAESYIELESDEINEYIRNHLEKMGYIVVYMKEYENYIVAFDKQTANQYENLNRKYLFKDKGIRVFAVALLLSGWGNIIFSEHELGVKIFLSLIVIFGSFYLMKMIRYGIKWLQN